MTVEYSVDDSLLPFSDVTDEVYAPIADFELWLEAVCRAADAYYLSLGDTSYEF